MPQPSDLTATYTCSYDAWNRLVEVEDGANVVTGFEYDGLNRRVKAHLDTDETAGVDTYRHFYYNASWQLLETRVTDTESDQPENLDVEMQYVWSPRYIDAPVLRDRDADDDSQTGDLGVTGSGLDERLYYLTDANPGAPGNVTCLTDTGGDAVERYVYDPYGNVTVYSDDWSETRETSSYDNNILYCGYYHDWETGLYHVRRRYYHPTLGRWTSRDPAGYVAGMNAHEYVRSQPLNGTDPAGLVCVLHSPWWFQIDLGLPPRPRSVLKDRLRREVVRDSTRVVVAEEDPGECNEHRLGEVATKIDVFRTRSERETSGTKGPVLFGGKRYWIVTTRDFGDVVESRVICRCAGWHYVKDRSRTRHPDNPESVPHGMVADCCWWDTTYSSTERDELVAIHTVVYSYWREYYWAVESPYLSERDLLPRA